MGTNFWWIYDLILAAVVISSIWNCAKRGFSKIIILLIGCAASVFLASLLSEKCSQFIYDSFVKKASIEAVNEALEEYDPALTIKEAVENQEYGAVLDAGKINKILQSKDPIEKLYEYTNQAAGSVVDTHENFKNTLTDNFSELLSKQLGLKLPPYVLRELDRRISGNGELFAETADMLFSKPKEVPGYIEENFIRQPALKLVRAFVFIIAYFIFMMVIRVVIYKAIDLGLLNGYDRLDHIMGGILGLIQAAAMVIVMAVLVKIMLHIAESEGSFISYETVEKTKLFRYVFDYIGKY